MSGFKDGKTGGERENRKKIAASLIAGAVLALTITGALFLLDNKISSVEKRLSRMESGIFTEVEKNNEVLKSLYAGSSMMADDLEEIRHLLNLSGGGYGLKEDPFERTAEENTGDESASSIEPGMDESLFFQAVERMDMAEENRLVQRSIAEAFREKGRIFELLSSYGLRLQKRGNLEWEIVPKTHRKYGTYELRSFLLRAAKSSENTYRIRLRDQRKNETKIELSADAYLFAEEDIDTMIEAIRKGIEEAEKQRKLLGERQNAMRRFIDSQELRTIYREKSLHLRTGEESGNTHSYGPQWEIAHTVSGEKVLAGIDAQTGELYLIDEKGRHAYSDAEECKRGLKKRLLTIDGRTTEEKAVARSQSRIKKMAEDEAFEAFLAQRGLSLRTEPREGNDHLYFDLVSTAEVEQNGEKTRKNRLGSFAVLKKNGKIYLVDSEEVMISSLARLDEGIGFTYSDEANGDQSLPEEYSTWIDSSVGELQGFFVLLCGVHEENADTIMLAHFDKERIGLLSIPRDLYYRNRKLASYYQAYGPARLMKIVSELTELPIDGYLSVDMYAFIEIIDILGGIEVELETALIDPTYKVREDGVWKTLYYPAGTYRLGGIETLRIARSRHTSDDYDRSHRQQLIVGALKERINRLHAGSVDKVGKIFKTLYAYVETDYSVLRMISIFTRYHEVPVMPLDGPTTDNILYATYSNLLRLGKSREEVSADFPKGAWILMPREDDWNAIRWYVRETFDL
jgi:polyisoprenyl-teichoic acid--peptidoglycan teichoic acid transferase